MQLGTLSVTAVRLLIPWIGVWIADCELDDVAISDPLPSGAQSLTINGVTLKGTIDVRGTGHYGERATARLVGGGNGWGNIITPKNFHNDASGGVTSTQVLNAIASAIGEQVVDASPLSYGPDFDTIAGRASQVLDGRDWYVDASGVTQVQMWPTLQPSSDLLVLEYDAAQRRATFSADTVVWPGTVITDSRFETLIARDIEMSFTEHGVRGVLWHSASDSGRLVDALEALIDGVAPSAFLKTYRYRIVKQGVDGRLQLQAVQKSAGIPDSLAIIMNPGIAGFSATWTGQQLGLIVNVQFLEGDRTLPRVVGFDGRAPTTTTIDAAQTVKIGANATAFAARADLVGNELGAIETTLGTGVADLTTGAVTFSKPYSPGNVAAMKAKVE